MSLPTIFCRSINRYITSIAKDVMRTFSTVDIKPSGEEPDKLYKIVELELRSNDKAVLNSFSKFATIAGGHLGIESKA